jgi:hypothetical protein
VLCEEWLKQCDYNSKFHVDWNQNTKPIKTDATNSLNISNMAVYKKNITFLIKNNKKLRCIIILNLWNLKDKHNGPLISPMQYIKFLLKAT